MRRTPRGFLTAMERHVPATPAHATGGRGSARAAVHPRRSSREAALFFLTLLLSALALPTPAQQQSIVNSPHNLSAGGPGSIRATAEQEICIFCHTPHNAAPIQPLWNRNVPVSAYTVYSSPSLKAKPKQPTGSSKLCLSCHDGSIALGNVLSRGQSIPMAGGVTTLPPGKSNLGTDLSDDHPVSFDYDAAASQNPRIKQRALLPTAVRVDAQREMQCTSCHEPHNNEFGKFLVMNNANSQLCNTCHVPDRTDIRTHDQCASCHQPHTAPSGPYLLTAKTTTDTCTNCHRQGAGPNQGPDVLTDLHKFGGKHDTLEKPVDVPHVPDMVACNDCHEPHTMNSGTAAAPLISPRLGAIDGVNASGTKVDRAQNGYEVCFKCHADQAAKLSPRAVALSRQITQPNTRLQFQPAGPSYHPVVAAGRNNHVPSLLPGLTTASVIACTDCHSSDSTNISAGGSGGPHGSNTPYLLKLPYETEKFTAESAQTYALCYSCHDRNKLLNDVPGPDNPFPLHRKHVVDGQSSCAFCHDGHGINSGQGNMTNNAHLINFARSFVSPSNATGRLEYIQTAPNSGTCTLSCHGTEHNASPYGALPAAAAPQFQGLQRRLTPPRTPARPPIKSPTPARPASPRK